MRDERLFGVWDSAPSEYGSMESSWLCLRRDGTGWTAWANAAGGASVSRFEWTCPGPDELELRYHWTLSGTGKPGSPPVLVDIDEEGPDDTLVRTAYTISQSTSPMVDGSFTSLEFDESVEFCYTYRQLTQDTDADDPATGLSSP